MYQVGDDSVAGWLTTGLYFVLFAMACIRFKRHGDDRNEYRLWLFLLILFLALGINKQLDIQTDMIAFFKEHFIRSGFLKYKTAFTISLVFSGVMFLIFSAWVFKRIVPGVMRRYRFIGVGLVLLFAFLFARILTFNFTLGMDVLRFAQKTTAYLELPAQLLILLGIFSQRKVLKQHA